MKMDLRRPLLNFALFIVLRSVAVINAEDEPVKLEKVMVLSGKTAELPCDITPPTLDSLYLVLWYKNDSDFPIYKYDARRSRENYRQEQTQHDSQMFLLQQQQQYAQLLPKSRIHFQFDSHPALLLLNNVVDLDEGIYRCRVDFGRSPTRNIFVQLSVIVPPEKIRIIEDNRQVSSVIGPYDEGDQLSLNCIVTGGRPRPEVTWWLGDKLVDYTYIATSDDVVQNMLVIKQLERHHLYATLRCQASNYFGVRNDTLSYAVQPYWYEKQQYLTTGHREQQHAIASSVQLDLNLRPSWVVITSLERPLSAGKPYTIECVTGGYRPSAKLRWYLDSIQQTAQERMTTDGSNTTSSFKLVPSAKHHGAELICSAINPLLVANNGTVDINESISSIQTRRKLIVYFAPTAELELGRNLKPDSIKEGNDIYFECRIRSNPPPHRFSWTHEGQNVKENASAGVIMAEQSLVIRRVSRFHSGRYSCSAVNTEGSGVSNIVHLRVMFQPVCRPGQKILYGVAKQDTIAVKCQTDAIPPADSYRWALNTSISDVTELMDNQISQNDGPARGIVEAGGINTLSYSPQSDRDYGSLLCWARNLVGEQREPCVYRVFLGVRPDPPSNCTVLNQTADTVEVWCRPGFDGGHPQQFQFEIFDTQSAVLLYNKSGRYPHLRVGNLESDVKLFIQISSYNQRGRSPVVLLEAYTIKIAEKQTVIMETKDWASMLGIASGIPVAILIACTVVILMARIRRRHNHLSTQREHVPRKVDDTKADLKIIDNVQRRQHNAEDPDIIVNGTSVHELKITQHGHCGSERSNYLRKEIIDQTQHEDEFIQPSRCSRTDLDKPVIVTSNQYYSSLNRTSYVDQPWIASDADTVVIVQPLRHIQMPVHLL